MSVCDDCGAKMGFVAHLKQAGICDDCHEKNKVKRATEEQLRIEIAKENKHAAQKKSELIDKILLTTETAPNLNITKRIEIVTAECAFGMNIFKDLFAGVRDIFGGRSKAVQNTMRDARRTALYELKVEAHLVGANAVVGVDLDYVELSAAGSMVMLVASGTAVVIED